MVKDKSKISTNTVKSVLLKGGNVMVAYIIMAVIAYAIGSINFSVLVSRKMAGFDVR